MVAEYVVEIQVFQGPLDLLLQLIEKEDLDITTVSLAQVTDQYLSYLEQMPRRDPAELVTFLDIVVKLLWIKSQALLPLPPAPPEEKEAVGEDLVRLLQEYRHYKQVSQQLQHWLKQGRRTFDRLAPPILPISRPAELENATLDALLTALQRRFQEIAEQDRIRPLPVPRRVTLRDKARRIHNLLSTQELVSFHTLLAEAPSREEVVVTLWAVLEMFKRHWIVFRQEDLFGPITIRRRSDSDTAWGRGEEWWAEFEDID